MYLNASNNENMRVMITMSQKLEKVIPDTPEGEIPVHLRKKQIYSQN